MSMKLTPNEKLSKMKVVKDLKSNHGHQNHLIWVKNEQDMAVQSRLKKIVYLNETKNMVLHLSFILHTIFGYVLVTQWNNARNKSCRFLS